MGGTLNGKSASTLYQRDGISRGLSEIRFPVIVAMRKFFLAFLNVQFTRNEIYNSRWCPRLFLQNAVLPSKSIANWFTPTNQTRLGGKYQKFPKIQCFNIPVTCIQSKVNGHSGRQYNRMSSGRYLNQNFEFSN